MEQQWNTEAMTAMEGAAMEVFMTAKVSDESKSAQWMWFCL